ncbi:AraC family transcriptional regulator [Paenibacillus methanolicus]|uniref:AraC-like DNA-binding protein n=1 Tax=Paenibacillus methanolicus TaxID=582686 RepID=A0A5S5C0B2_9BACL|nr:AraC family transcriptional regulator [Paenibacillus methanolicus]TYP72048.1 AraC-like DNA-binding protein [Paenibacillus methanolicus]
MNTTNFPEAIRIPPGFWEGLRQLGIVPSALARQARLPLDIDAAPFVTTAQYFAIWQAYAELAGDIAQGIVKLATAFETAQYPPTVLAPYHARDYREALVRMARYKQLCPPESLSIAEEGERCVIDLNWQCAGESGPPLLAGITLAFLLELGRRGTGKPLTARLVEFSQSMGDTRVLEAYFGCPVRTGASRNRLTLRRRDLELPFSSYNEELLDILTPALDHLLVERRSGRTVAETVIRIMKRRLSEGGLDIRSVAKELGMSDRTLQRRLADEQASFKQLLTQARREQARAFLADPSLDIKEVAFLIGYEDQNSFYRAFRLWEGDTPANWRLAHAGRTSIGRGGIVARRVGAADGARSKNVGGGG